MTNILLLSKIDSKGVKDMPNELKKYEVSNVVGIKEIDNTQCRACNDTPVYQTSVVRYDPGIDCSNKPNFETKNIT